MDNIYVYVVDLPPHVHEMITPCADGFTVYLDARLSRIGQMRAYDHALRHIKQNDFDRQNVQHIEFYTHKGGKNET